MLEQNVTIHDKHQIEIKLAYELDSYEKARAYDISLYLFFPVSLGITPTTYEKRDFFNDYMGYIRIKTPSLLLNNIVTGANNPLGKLENAMKMLSQKPDSEKTIEFERHLKMFCCILKSALRDHVATLNTRTQDADQKDIVEQFLKNVGVILKSFRELRSTLNAPSISSQNFSKYLFADEYVSLTVESSVYKMLENLKTKKNGSFDSYKKDLLMIAKQETEYRSENGYPSIPNADGDNETLLFRKSVLKKFFESVLFLSIQTKREGVFMEQTAFALAAGLSMFFATTIAFFFQRRYGNLTLPFFVALVVSYMFKDRLKDFVRISLGALLKRYVFDRRMNIYVEPGQKNRIGLCRESFNFVNEKSVPEDIWRLRSRDHITEIENGWVGETVIHYHKQVQLLPDWFKAAQEDYQIEGINDILRLNLSKYLLRMADPVKSFMMCKDFDYCEASGDRVYHINAITQCRSSKSFEQRRFRIVVNKEGIKRVEQVSNEHH